MDNVLNNMSTVLIDILNSIYGTNVPQNIKTYNLNELFPSLTTEQIFNPLTLSSFWDKLEVNQEALSIIDELKEKGHEIYLVTAQIHEGFAYKYNWMIKNITNIPIKNYIFCHDKHLLNLDVLIDDYIDNLINFQGLKILLSKSYNEKLELSEDIKRINSFEELKEFL